MHHSSRPAGRAAGKHALRRMAAAFLAVLMLLTLTACLGKDNTSAEESSATETTPEETSTATAETTTTAEETTTEEETTTTEEETTTTEEETTTTEEETTTTTKATETTTAAETTAKSSSGDFADRLSTYTTYLNTGLVNRTTNIRLATNAINGTVLQPGETFSYNTTVGPRTSARGYKDATVYTATGTEPGLGGGICQVSSTLYVACLYADMQIVTRFNHRYTVAYVPLGWDATVSYGVQDYRFKNNTDYPVKIVASLNGGSLTVSLYGTKDGSGKTVSLETVTDASDPYKTVEIKDSSLPAGTRKTVNDTGHSGYTVRLFRVVKVNGKTTRTQENKSVYTRLDVTTKVGTGSGAETTASSKATTASSVETTASSVETTASSAETTASSVETTASSAETTASSAETTSSEPVSSGSDN